MILPYTKYIQSYIGGVYLVRIISFLVVQFPICDSMRCPWQSNCSFSRRQTQALRIEYELKMFSSNSLSSSRCIWTRLSAHSDLVFADPLLQALHSSTRKWSSLGSGCSPPHATLVRCPFSQHR